MVSHARIVINGTGVEFDRNYGVANRTGWTALRSGHVLVEFVSLFRAVSALVHDVSLDPFR